MNVPGERGTSVRPEHRRDPDGPVPSHELLVYSDEQHLGEVAAPLLLDAVDAGHVVVVISEHNDLLARALGAEARHVDFADPAAWYARPAATFASYQQLVDQRLAPGGAYATVLAEAVWVERGHAELSEWQRLEAAANPAFASAPMRILCGYDRRRAPEYLRQAAHRTHPAVCDAGGVEASESYEDPERFIDELERTLDLPEPPGSALRLPIAGDLARVRAEVRAQAVAAGLSHERCEDAVLASHELLTNQVKYTQGRGELVVWAIPDELVCEVRDPGGSRPPALAGYLRPSEGRAGGWGLVVVRQLADLVHVRRRTHDSMIRAIFRS